MGSERKFCGTEDWGHQREVVSPEYAAMRLSGVETSLRQRLLVCEHALLLIKSGLGGSPKVVAATALRQSEKIEKVKNVAVMANGRAKKELV